MTGLNHLGNLAAVAHAAHLIVKHRCGALAEALIKVADCVERQDIAGTSFWRAVSDETAAAIAGSQRRLADLPMLAPSHATAEPEIAAKLAAGPAVKSLRGGTPRRPEKPVRTQTLAVPNYVEDAPLARLPNLPLWTIRSRTGVSPSNCTLADA